ncbi:hypothetical protein [Maribacter sp. 2210JD10-5]|uniref:hypothetical protein n=1 Tax=Maribacter sp. 2210JD10-5 TaxID=3386272 RepID=UPI0039BC3306
MPYEELFIGLSIPHQFKINYTRISIFEFRNIIFEMCSTINSKAPTEIAQPYHSNPSHADMLRQSVSVVFPLSAFPTPSEPHERTSGKRPLDHSSPYPQ